REQEGFVDLSFDTISAYGPNAAMMHYSAKPGSEATLKPEGLLLVDSGAHYLEGTTDITRTIALGELTQQMKEYYTTVLRCNLRLAAAKFPKGVTGLNLDVLSRGPVWDLGLDYRCGTGHGVGHILNVHEGPNSFRWRTLDGGKAAELVPGMITTDEPGLYIEDGFGIRIENELLCVEDETTEYGSFRSLEPITFAPIDLDPVIPDMLTAYEKKTLNDYHALVYKTLSPYLSDEEKAWLKQETREI
ncbi:MAG: M24 family metallopeptidase, partial [Pseudobutyrivibrio sp.]|nr:M24 family metallopeptidase [Pseudobutyrivibrio sp.]MCF0187672.1 M24 family metallopeptidase [Bacteroidaceae bacterium]